MISLSGLTATIARTLGLSWPDFLAVDRGADRVDLDQAEVGQRVEQARIDVLAGQVDHFGVRRGSRRPCRAP